MNFEQIKGIVERVLTIAVTYAIAKGLVPQALGGELITFGVLGISIIWGWVVNKPQALADAAKATQS